MFLREWRAAPSLMATGMALYERFIYHADGSFLTGSLADHAVPTAGTVPELTNRTGVPARKTGANPCPIPLDA